VSVDDIRIDAPTRGRVVGRLAALLDSFYLSPEVGKRMSDSLHARLKRGAYDRYTNGPTLAIHLRADLDDIAHDKHLQILYSLLPRGPEPQPDTVIQQRRLRDADCPVWATERLEGNVGHLRFDEFVDPAECRSSIVTSMHALADTKALIIDLRENAGGGKAGSTPLLESYLFDRRTHLSDVRFRYTGETRERWTLDSVAGARFGGVKPVYVLLPRIRVRQVRNWRTTCKRSSARRSWARRRPAKPMRHLKPALKTTLASCCPPARRSTR